MATTLPITLTELIAEILDGNFDSDLDALDAVIKERKTTLTSRIRFELKAGDRIKIVGQLKPRYLVGLYGRVVRVNDKSVTIEFEDPEQARRYRAGVLMPFAFVEKA